MKINYFKFKALWVAIVEKVYDFEGPYETSKEIEEVGSLFAAFLHYTKPLRI